MGQLFGRVAHLLDAVEDYDDDLARGKWNPLAATETPMEQARVLCDDAALGIELALADVEFTDGRLPQQLLTREVRRAISRTFSGSGHPTCSGTPHGQQEPINFGNQPVGAGYPNPGGEYPEGETPDPGRGGAKAAEVAAAASAAAMGATAAATAETAATARNAVNRSRCAITSL